MLIISGTQECSETYLSLPKIYNHAVTVSVYPLQHIRKPKYNSASQLAIDQGILRMMLNHCDTNSCSSPAKRSEREKTHPQLFPFLTLSVVSFTRGVSQLLSLASLNIYPLEMGTTPLTYSKIWQAQRSRQIKVLSFCHPCRPVRCNNSGCTQNLLSS